MISPLAVLQRQTKLCNLPLPGVQPVLVSETGKELEGNGVEGRLCIKFPWPSIIRTTYGNHDVAVIIILLITKDITLPVMAASAMKTGITASPAALMM